MPGTGHFHVYVDVPKAEQQGEGETIPFDDAHKHFGKGQTAADLELSPVSHEGLQQLAGQRQKTLSQAQDSSRADARSAAAVIAAVHVGSRQGDVSAPRQDCQRCCCCCFVLAQGKHTLTLQLANALHESYGPTYNSSITVNVK